MFVAVRQADWEGRGWGPGNNSEACKGDAETEDREDRIV